MIEYNPYEVDVLEQIKEIIVEDARFKNILNREHVYLSTIPEESRGNDIVIRLTYLTIYETVFYSNKSHGDRFTIQIDVWDFEKEPIGLANLIRNILEGIGFYQVGSEFGVPDEDGSYRDGRRYEGVLSKVNV